MIEVEVSGAAVPRFSRREVSAFVESCIKTLRRAGATKRDINQVSIRFVDDSEMARLNATFRGKKKTTDVLTFENEVDEMSALEGTRSLGDIVISVQQAQRQAVTERHSLAVEIRYLLLHGVIHAFGYDHEKDNGEMNALEERIRPRVGLA